VKRIVGIAIALLAVNLSVLSVAAPTPAAARGDTLDVTLRYLVAGGGVLTADGGGDVVGVRVGIAVDQPAKVVLAITNDSGTVVRGPVPLGTLSAGRHFWKWGERRDDGTRVRDGGFTAVVMATFAASGLTQQSTTGFVVDSVYRPGRVHIGYRTIYPRSTATHDATTLSNRADEYARTAMVVRSAAGTVVFRKYFPWTSFRNRTTWDGRDAQGRVVPSGTYTIRFAGRDWSGNSGRTAPVSVAVSAERLVLRTRTLTVSPDASGGQWTCFYPGGPNGCGDPGTLECGTIVASDRFSRPGAFSYRSGQDCRPEDRWQVTGDHAAALSGVAPRGYREMSVSFLGGPTTPGAADQGELVLRDAAGPVIVSSGPDTGDHTTTSPTVPIPLSEANKEFPGSGPNPDVVAWSFMTRNGASYDVASFTVRYSYLTPQR
jgi:flagellar hook assembly protein FlgD